MSLFQLLWAPLAKADFLDTRDPFSKDAPLLHIGMKRSLAVFRRAQISAEERYHIVLKAVSDGAGMGTVINLKAVGYGKVVEDIVQLAGIDSKASWSPTSIAIARYWRRWPKYWSINAKGALAAHLAITSGWGSPSLLRRSRKNGGFFVSGDHAAAEAS